MNDLRIKRVAAGCFVVIAAVLAIVWSGATSAQSSKPADEMDKRCRDLVGEFAVMGSNVVSMDQRMDEKMLVLQQASEAERLDAMEAVLEELVAQRREMRRYLKLTHQQMMVHLMEHTVRGNFQSTGDPFSECPLVRQMMKEDVASGTGSVQGPLDR